MTRDDINRLIQDNGLFHGTVKIGVIMDINHLEKFAALVAAAEREKVARWQISSGYTTGHGETIEDLLVELEWQVRESEREACAKVCEELELKSADGECGTYVAGWSDGTDDCAAAIRERN